MVIFSLHKLSVWFGQLNALKELSLEVREKEILSVIGPANSGKTTFLRALNRLNELEPRYRHSGHILFKTEPLQGLRVEEVRRAVGMVFALPAPLPLSIFDNVAYGVRMNGERSRKRLVAAVERGLSQAYLWDEVKDRLKESAFKLSGGQQQRLCIARTLAVEPEVILYDEPCSGLDPISTAKVEEAMLKLKSRYTQVLVTNNVKQAARVGDRTAFFLGGQLLELEKTEKLFTAPSDARTDDYLRGKFG